MAEMGEPKPGSNAGPAPAPHPSAAPQAGSAPFGHIVYTHQRFPFGPDPENVFCPHCRQECFTRLKRKAGLFSWFAASVCVLFGCIYGCCLLPFFIGECLDVEHYCSLCGAFLGRYRRHHD